MSALEIAKIDLVIANRVMARIGAVDALGHVSLRHPDTPDRYLISRSLSPEFVEIDNILILPTEGDTSQGDGSRTYRESYIHSELYCARSDVAAVVHGHADAILPFSVTDAPLRPVFFGANEYGGEAPAWDIRDDFGDTDLLIRDAPRGRAAARAM